MLTLLYRIAFRYLLSSPTRAGLIALGVALGVALQIATSSASKSVAVSFDKMVQQLSGKADATIKNPENGLSVELSGELLEIEGVTHAAGLVEMPVRDPKTGRPMLIVGMDFLGDPYFLMFDSAAGDKPIVDDALAFINDPHALLVSRTLAARRGVRAGDHLELMTTQGPTKFLVRGIVEDTGPAAAFDGQVVIMFLDAAQVAFERGDRVDRIELAFDETVDPKVMLERVRKVVGNRGQVELPEERRQHFAKLLEPLHAVLRLASVLALVIAMFLTYNAVSIAVAQRRVQIGIIRALGATRTSVVGLFCFEALLLALPASALGVVLGRYFASSMLEQTLPTIALAQGYMPLRPPDPELELSTVIEAVLTGTLATVLAAFVPSLRAARVDPAITVRSGALLESMRSLPRRTMVVAGLVLSALIAASTSLRSMNVGLLAAVLVLAVVVLVTPDFLVRVSWLATRLTMPVVVRLGITSISRDLRRSTISVIALASAVTFAVTLGVWIASMKQSVTSWFDRSVTPDLSVTAGSPLNDQYNVPFSDVALGKLQGVPGVDAALPYRTGTQIRGGLNLVLLGTDTQLHTRLRERQGRIWETVDGDAFRPEGYARERKVALSEGASRHIHKKAGDRLQLETPNGPVEFRVEAVIDGYYLDHPAIFIDRKWLAELWKDARVDAIDIVLAKDADPAKVAEAVRDRLGGGQALFVVRAGEVQRQTMQFVDDGFGYARSIEWITLIVALMGVMGTMLAVVLDRRRELGVFRALGATRLQVAFAISVEAFALGLAAALLGTACGALQGFVLLKGVVGPSAQWDLEYVLPPLVVLRVVALVTLSTVLAALMPAYRAARIEVTRALTTE